MSTKYQTVIFYIAQMLFFTNLMQAQNEQSYANEYAISSANDAFLIIGEDIDRFYSFGFGTSLKFQHKKIVGLEKLFPNKVGQFFEVGFRIEGYTPTDKEVTAIEIKNNTITFDRPFAGVTFGTFNTTYTFKRSYFKTGVILGLMGRSSKAGDIQSWFHKNITNDTVFKDEWEFQVPNQFLYNLNLKYAYDFLPNGNWFDIFSTAEAQLGNLAINATPTVGMRLGKFEKITQSLGFDNNILADRNTFELFLQSSIAVTANVFDASAQGNIFNRNFEFAVAKLNTFHTTITHSIYLAYKRFSFGYEQYFTKGKTLKGAQHSYARIVLKYKF